MGKTGLLISLCLLCFLGLTGAGQESVQLLNLYETGSDVVQAMPDNGHPLAVAVGAEDLNGVSSSVLKAESWLRIHVLAHFPATKITTIVAGNNIHCRNGKDDSFRTVLPSLKNIHHSLARWGLEREIKVSAAFSSSCFSSHSPFLEDDLAEKVTKPLLEFLRSANSTYSMNLPPKFSPSSDETMALVSSHADAFKRLASFVPDRVNVIVTNPKQEKPSMNRKLSALDSKIVNPYPARPTPLPEATQPPLHSSIGFSVPASRAQHPHPPLSHTAPPLSLPVESPPPLSFPLGSPPPFSFHHASPPPMSLPFAPEQPPFTGPATAPYGYSFPPCNPAGDSMPPAPAPATVVAQKLWCMAKPTVPEETLQEALDYACGEGGADCAEIKPEGSCFNPDTVVAHASYAFNSYWQRTKRNGGSCSFGGTAMLINSDPSFLHCQFVLS